MSFATLRFFIKEFIRKATHPHPCPLPSRERVLKNRPSLEGRGLREKEIYV